MNIYFLRKYYNLCLLNLMFTVKFVYIFKKTNNNIIYNITKYYYKRKKSKHIIIIKFN